MSRISAPRISILIIVVVILVVNAILFSGRLFSWVSDSAGTTMAPLRERIARLRAMITIASDRTDLAARVAQLEEENGRLRGETAQLVESRREAAFYRAAAGIEARPSGTLLEAGIFSFNTAGGVQQVIINRGTQQGVAVGQVIITVRGELLGIVQSVFARHAIVWRVTDRSFQVTARVADSDVTGLVRSDGSGSLLMDLVQKNEVVGELLRVVTSGDDAFPSGLVIGTIRSVDNNAATLFQIVRIDPAVGDVIRGPVFVVLP